MVTELKRIHNPPNPFERFSVEWLGEPPSQRVHVFEEHAKSILSRNDSPDIPFRYGINPYRGCFHACSYCYARPTHHYLDFGAGRDFETKLVAKVNAAELLQRAFESKSWKGEVIMLSGNTDCYQPLEASYELTRQCLEVCLKYRNPVCIITKGALIQRDVDVIQALSKVTGVRVHFSLAFSDSHMARKVEPHTPAPESRLRAMEVLAESGIEVGVAASPVIPGLNDSQIPEVLRMAREAGAQSAFMTLLRLPTVVKDVFFDSLESNFSTKSQKVKNAILEMKGGALNRSEFGKRMVGDGKRWQAIDWMFKSTCDKLGLKYFEEGSSRISTLGAESTFRRPQSQLSLWE